MAANVKMITPPHVAELQRLRLENAGLRTANAIMAARLAELGVDANALVQSAPPPPAPVVASAPPAPVVPVVPVQAPRLAPIVAAPVRSGVPMDPPSTPRIPGGPVAPTRPPQFAEAQIGGSRVTQTRPAAPAARGPAVPIIAGPAPRMPAGVPAIPGAVPIIHTPDGSTVQLLPNVTRNAPRAAAPAPVPVAPVAAPVAPVAHATSAPAPDVIRPTAPPTTLDEDARMRFSLLEID